MSRIGTLAEGGVAAVLAHGETAHQAHHDAAGAGRVDDAVGLGEHAVGAELVGVNSRHEVKVPIWGPG